MKEVSSKQASQAAKEKTKDKKEKPVRPLTKVIIRRLPPTITEEAFIEQISPIPDHDYFYFVEADMSLGAAYAFCRAYINFKNTEDIFVFKEKFDNYIFVDNKGNEYNAVVEYAPYQGVPKKKSRKSDPKCGTIESDQHYIDFLANLKAEENDTTKSEPKTEFSYQIKDDKKITTTPLLEYIAARKLEREKQRLEKKEERRKKDLENKKMRNEERKKKKVEIKPRSSINEEVREEKVSKSVETPRKTDNNDYGVPSNEIHDWNYLWNLIHGEDEESNQNKEKSVKPPEASGSRAMSAKEKDDTVKPGPSKCSKEPMKPKGKGFKERREETFKKPYEEKRPDSRYRNRDDKKYENDKFNKRPDYRTNYGKERKREDDRKFRDDEKKFHDDDRKSSGSRHDLRESRDDDKKFRDDDRKPGGSRHDLRDCRDNDKVRDDDKKIRDDDRKSGGSRHDLRESRKYDSREFRSETVVKPPQKEAPKKYSETRKEREARRNELKRLATIRAEKEAAAAAEKNQNESAGEAASNHPTTSPEANLEKVSDEVENLAEDLELKVAIVDENLSGGKDQIKIAREVVDNSGANQILEKEELAEATDEKDESTVNENLDNLSDNKAACSQETENKVSGNDKRNCGDRKDPRTERRIRNKDRPSMAIYQPGKARLSHKDKSSSADESAPVPEH